MIDYFKAVNEFMTAGDQPRLPDGEVDIDVLRNRMAMLIEEVREGLVAFEAGDHVGIADAIADVKYVVVGGLLEINEVREYREFPKSTWDATKSARVHYYFQCWESHLERRINDLGASQYDSVMYQNLPRTVKVNYLGTLNLIQSQTISIESMGYPLMELFEEVQRSNMTKVVEGRLIKSPTGKILKPDSYSPPELKLILEKTGIL